MAAKTYSICIYSDRRTMFERGGMGQEEAETLWSKLIRAKDADLLDIAYLDDGDKPASMTMWAQVGVTRYHKQVKALKL